MKFKVQNSKFKINVVIILILLSSALFFFKLGSFSLYDAAETTYGEFIKQMRLTGDWLTLRYNAEIIFDKPPLYYWLATIATYIFGFNAFAVRFWAAVCAEDCPTVVREIFADGSQPTQPDNLYRVYEINRETGFLATVFTPPQLVEQRVYLAFPPEAHDWAEANGFSTPPDSYDAIQLAFTNLDVSISAPSTFADVRGEVEITGTATGDDLDYYRVLVGQGLNPPNWVQVGTDSRSLVVDGLLATWDTSELNGLYAVQLQAVLTDQRIETDVIQVTVDNTPPEMGITYPQDGDEFEYASNRQMAFQVVASDNLSLAAVDFFVDGVLVGSVENAPFALTWRARRGEHHLQVLARDRAGNESEEEIQFTIK